MWHNNHFHFSLCSFLLPVRHNRLSALPPEIGNLLNLTTLNRVWHTSTTATSRSAHLFQ
jgi:hypothetical protein